MSEEHKDEAWLRTKYCDEGLSLRNIAMLVDRDEATIRYWMIKFGIPRRGKSVRFEKHPNWKGGRIQCGQDNRHIGILYPNHPQANAYGYILEQRLMMGEHLGRYLRSKEVVHHINGDPSDNRIENLMLFASNGEHLQFHALKRRALNG